MPIWQLRLEHSVIGTLGQEIEPVIKPLGFDWKIGTALIGVTAAKEVFVSQLAIVYAVGSEDEGTSTLRLPLFLRRSGGTHKAAEKPDDEQGEQNGNQERKCHRSKYRAGQHKAAENNQGQAKENENQQDRRTKEDNHRRYHAPSVSDVTKRAVDLASVYHEGDRITRSQ